MHSERRTTYAAVDRSVAAAIACPGGTNIIATLDLGQTVRCTAGGTAVAGRYTNVGTAATTVGGQTVSASNVDHYLGTPTIMITNTPRQGCPPQLTGLALSRTTAR